MRHPDELDRLDRGGGRRRATTYLDAVIKETLRLRPVLADRACASWPSRCEIGGTAAAGRACSVAPCIYLVHRRPDIYPGARAVPARALPRAARPGPTRGSRSAAACAAASARASPSSRWRRRARAGRAAPAAAGRTSARALGEEHDHQRPEPRGGGAGGAEMSPDAQPRRAQAKTRASLLDSAAAAVQPPTAWSGTSVDQIAADAGYTKGAFYANFKSKEELFLVMLDEKYAAEARALRGRAPRARASRRRRSARPRRTSFASSGRTPSGRSSISSSSPTRFDTPASGRSWPRATQATPRRGWRR